MSFSTRPSSTKCQPLWETRPLCSLLNDWSEVIKIWNFRSTSKHSIFVDDKQMVSAISMLIVFLCQNVELSNSSTSSVTGHRAPQLLHYSTLRDVHSGTNSHAYWMAEGHFEMYAGSCFRV